MGIICCSQFAAAAWLKPSIYLDIHITSVMDSQKYDMVMFIMGLVAIMLILIVGSHVCHILVTFKSAWKDLQDMKERIASVEAMQARFANFDGLLTCRNALKNFEDMHCRTDYVELYDTHMRELWKGREWLRQIMHPKLKTIQFQECFSRMVSCSKAS